MRTLIILILANLLGASETVSVGWRRDGSGIFPGCTPPKSWCDGSRYDEKTKAWVEAPARNLRWKVAMPEWSASSPIIVDDRVYVACEALSGGMPWLLCHSLADGRELWRVELDHLPFLGLPAAETARLRQEWSEINLQVRDTCQVQFGQKWVTERRQTAPDDVLVKEHDALVAKWDLKPGPATNSNMYAIFPTKAVPGRGRRLKELWQHNLFFPSWIPSPGGTNGETIRSQGSWVGTTGSTPLWDGARIIVLTGYNTVAAITPDGTVAWISVLPTPELKEPFFDRHRLLGHTWCSPFLLAGRIIVQSGTHLRALEPATGAIAWAVRLENANQRNNKLQAQHLGFTVGTIPCILANNGRIYRATDGAELARELAGPECVKEQFQSVLEPIGWCDGVLALNHYAETGWKGFKEGGRRAVRLEAKDGALAITELWHLAGWAGGGYFSQAVLTKDRIYGCDILDAASGGPLNPKQSIAVRGGHNGTPFSLVADGTVVIASTGDKGLFIAVDAQTGNELGRSWVRPAPDTPEKLRQRWRWGHHIGKSWQAPYFSGTAMVIRTHDFLFCLSEGGR
jgi:outer membrane protein assembly factor BamB